MNYKPIRKSSDRQRVIPYGLPIYNSDIIQEAGFNLDQLQFYYPLDNAVSIGSFNTVASFWAKEDSTIAFRTLIDGAATMIYSDGKIGGAGNFTGIENLRSTSSIPVPMQLGNKDFTVGCWVKLLDKTIDRSIILLSSNVTPTYLNALFHLKYVQATDRFQFIVGDGAGVLDFINLDALGSPTVGVWYFLIGQHKKDGNITVYVNEGTLLNTKLPVVRPTTILPKFFVGGAFTEGTLFMVGQIDEVFWFNRNLTIGEIQYLYNNGNGRRLLS